VVGFGNKFMAAGWVFVGTSEQLFFQNIVNAAVAAQIPVSVDNVRSNTKNNFVSTPSVQFTQDADGNVTASASAAAPGSSVDGGTF
jgi:cytoskeletal protein RodZ